MDDYKELRFVLDGIMADRIFIDIASAPMLVKLLAERDALLDQIELRRKAHALSVAETCKLIDERNAQAAEIKRLRAALRHQDERDRREGTHSDDCWSFGPNHYECAVRKLRAALQGKPK